MSKGSVANDQAILINGPTIVEIGPSSVVSQRPYGSARGRDQRWSSLPRQLGFRVLRVETDVIDEELEGTCGSSGGERDGSYVPAVGATKGGEGK